MGGKRIDDSERSPPTKNLWGGTGKTAAFERLRNGQKKNNVQISITQEPPQTQKTHVEGSAGPPGLSMRRASQTKKGEGKGGTGHVGGVNSVVRLL